MKCKKCGKEIEDYSLFCKHCGKNQQDTMKCNKCGKEIEDNSLFCKYCGKNQQEKKYLPVLKGYQYAIIVLWLLINLYCLSTYTMDNAKRYLYPFQGSNSFHGPTLDYYDFSEFLLYGLGGVALMVSIWLYIGSKKKE
jgi:hypothetical protein